MEDVFVLETVGRIPCSEVSVGVWSLIAAVGVVPCPQSRGSQRRCPFWPCSPRRRARSVRTPWTCWPRRCTGYAPPPPGNRWSALCLVISWWLWSVSANSIINFTVAFGLLFQNMTTAYDSSYFIVTIDIFSGLSGRSVAAVSSLLKHRALSSCSGSFTHRLCLFQVSLQKVDITLAENKQWYKLYRYDIPVFHFDGVFLMKHRGDLPRLFESTRNLGGFRGMKDVHWSLTCIWVNPCEITQKSAILTPTLFDFGENWWTYSTPWPKHVRTILALGDLSGQI